MIKGTANPLIGSITGTDNIRAALNARMIKNNTANMARDLGITSEALDAFARGTTTLPNDKLQTLTLDLWHGFLVYDPERDVLMPAKKDPPRSLGIVPDPIKTEQVQYLVGQPQHGIGIQLPQVKPNKRPGWWGIW